MTIQHYFRFGLSSLLGLGTLVAGWAAEPSDPAISTEANTPRVGKYYVAKPVTEETVTRERVVVEKPVYVTEMQQRRTTVRKPVVVTEYRDQTHTVHKPVHQTSYKEEVVTVERPVTETVYYEQAQTINKPVYETSHQQQTSTVYEQRTTYVTAYVNGMWTQIPQTSLVPRTVVQNVPVQTVRYVQEQVTQRVPQQVQKMVAEQVVRKVPFDEIRYVQEQVTERIPVRVEKFIDEEIVEQVPVTVQKFVKEEVVRETPVVRHKIIYEERQGPVDAEGRPLPQESFDATSPPALDPDTGKPTTRSTSEEPPKTYAEDRVTVERAFDGATSNAVPRSSRMLTKQK